MPYHLLGREAADEPVDQISLMGMGSACRKNMDATVQSYAINCMVFKWAYYFIIQSGSK